MMGFASWATFHDALNEYRQQVHEHFQQLLVSPQADDEPADAVSLLTSGEAEKLQYLQSCGYQDSLASLATLDRLFSSHACKNLSHTGRGRLKKLLPLLVQAAASSDDPDACLVRLMPLLESIMRRSAYMALLVENPLALSQLIQLASASPLISHQLARYPLLLDELNRRSVCSNT